MEVNGGYAGRGEYRNGRGNGGAVFNGELAGESE